MINLWSDFTVRTFTTQSMHIHKYVVDKTEANKTTPPTTITAPVRNILIEQK